MPYSGLFGGCRNEGLAGCSCWSQSAAKDLRDEISFIMKSKELMRLEDGEQL